MGYLVDLDARHRVSLGKLGRPGRYLATELEGGSIILEPAVVITEDQAWLDSRPDVQARLRESLDETTLVRRGRPRRREP
jgi:hypothetical protein